MADELTVREIAEQVRSGERSAVEVLETALARIDVGNEALNAFVYLDPDGARASARAVDDAVVRGEDPGPLAGVPFGVKDLEDCAGMPTSHGSLLFKGRGPVDADSIQVSRLRAAGAVPVGKTAAPEFGTLNFTKTKAWGVTRNPWDLSRTPGGSSGGSAAAVAAGLVPFATASDGGGSTRGPAGFSGLVGMKASFGRIPHPGAQGPQTTALGGLTTTVFDAARHLDVAAGPDDRDRCSLPPAGLSYEQLADTLATAGLRARWSPDLGFAPVPTEVSEVVGAAATGLADAAGLELDDDPVVLQDPVRAWMGNGAIDLWLEVEPGMWPARADDLTYYSRWSMEQSEDLAMPRYARIVQRRAQLVADVATLFDEVDVLLCPTNATWAFAAEGPPRVEADGLVIEGAMVTPFCMLANLCWNPAISVPAGLSSEGLPLGLQIITRRHTDELPLRLARIWEQASSWPRFAPDYP
jgi:aspartyl-tRNA(Asn)/glutamyl-tRNA(Gln) amidotransferase subunit A